MLDTDRANTVDLMKFLLSYASNPFLSSEGNNLNKRDIVESSVRNLFGELFKLSYSAPGPNAFDSVKSQMAGRFEQTKLPPGQKIEMKRGDWLCPRYFLLLLILTISLYELSTMLLCVMLEHQGESVELLF